MEHDTRRLSDLARILLVVAVFATAVTTHFVDSLGVFRIEDLKAEEMSDALRWLDGFYASSEGLQRPTGIVVDGRMDVQAIATWLFRNYLQERARGRTPAEARDIVAKSIRETDEWRSKHPQ